jgi:hypothetical protein
LEKEFDKADFKGKPMRLCDSMPEYLVWVTKQQSDLADKVPEESRSNYHAAKSFTTPQMKQWAITNASQIA